MNPQRLLTLALSGLLAAPAAAAPPTLTDLRPRGCQRGRPAVVVLSGATLPPGTRLALPFKAEQKHLPDPKPNPAQVRLELTVAEAVTPGVYPVRAVNDEGVSALALFRVDTLPAVEEKED